MAGAHRALSANHKALTLRLPAVDGFLAQTALTREPEPGQLRTNQSGHRQVTGSAGCREQRGIHQVDCPVNRPVQHTSTATSWTASGFERLLATR